MAATRDYDALDRLESIGYTASDQTAPVTAHAYLYEAANRRTRARREDGNLLSDGRWAYTWDADNKHFGMGTHPVAVAAGAPEEKYQFDYDSGWRRIRTRVWRWDEEKLGDEADTLGAWVMVRDERTVYDEWNPVAQIDAAGQVVQRHLWGTDLSGSMQGAGGVGGLLGTWDNGATTRNGSEPGDAVARVWVCAYDGNGNVSAAIAATVAGGGGGGNGSGGAVRVARYDYDAFGKTLATWGDGAVAEANRYRFSTKPEDGTGLLDYGYRYLDTRLGRWVSRDPIEEDGGENLMQVALNDIIGKIDFWDCLLVIIWLLNRHLKALQLKLPRCIPGGGKVLEEGIWHSSNSTYSRRQNLNWRHS